MAVQTLTSVMTMAEAAKSIGADGQMLSLVDVVSQGTPLLEEGHWEEADDFNSHHFLQSMTEPVGTDSVINTGVSWEVATTKPVTEIIQGLESAFKIDIRILRKQKNAEEYKRAQVELFLRGLSKSFHDRVFYGNTTVAPTSAISPDQITGLHPRFNAISAATYNQIQGSTYWPLNVVSATGSSANVQSSIYAIKWGKDGVFFTFPRDGQDFIAIEDMPEIQLVYDANNKPFRAEVTFFNISFGLCVADWRCVQRLCNIDATHKWTSNLMIQLLAGFPDTDLSNVVIYVPRFVWIQMSQEANGNTNSFHFDDAPWGKKTVFFQDIPIRVCDRITQTEPVIS